MLQRTVIYEYAVNVNDLQFILYTDTVYFDVMIAYSRYHFEVQFNVLSQYDLLL